MKKFILFPLFALYLANQAKANNLTIINLTVDQTTQMVNFTLSWNNSWNLATAPNNWDAVWLFVKFKDCAGDVTLNYTHGTLSATTSDHTIPAAFEAMTSGGTGSSAQGAALDYTEGIMLRPKVTGQGTVTGAVSLKITNLPAAATTITTEVIGIEMVYIPQADFTVGDGSSTDRFSPTTTITSAFETAGSAISTIDYVATAGTLPSAFPKGQYGFYLMKYEISEQLYVDFLNTLGSNAQTVRYLGNVDVNRNKISQVTLTTYSTSRPYRAQNWLSWADYTALLDWACLRPFTELEYEKAARGTHSALQGEYAWGTTNIAAGSAFAGAAVEDGTETIATAGFPNAIYNSNTFTNGDGGTGPVRGGIYATSTSTRIQSGSSFYGVMDLSGNIDEYIVAIFATTSCCTPFTQAGSTFTRTWGDGNIDITTGNHNVGGGWPSASTSVFGGRGNLVGKRGGSWSDGTARLQVSDRADTYTPPSTTLARMNNSGGRGAR